MFSAWRALAPIPCTGLLHSIKTTPIAMKLNAWLSFLDAHKEIQARDMADKQTTGAVRLRVATAAVRFHALSNSTTKAALQR